jgi:hypothetical protein
MTIEAFTRLITAYIDGQAIEFKNSLGNWSIYPPFLNGADINRISKIGFQNYRLHIPTSTFVFVDGKFEKREADKYFFAVQERGKEITLLKTRASSAVPAEAAADAYLSGKPVYSKQKDVWTLLPPYTVPSDIVKFFDHEGHFSYKLRPSYFVKCKDTFIPEYGGVVGATSFKVLFEYGTPIGLLS